MAGFSLAALCAAGCGGRIARPAELVQPYDNRLSCAHLEGELDNNRKRLDELDKERGQRLGNNVGMAIISPLFLDFSNTLSAEEQSLVARNERLKALMIKQACPLE